MITYYIESIVSGVPTIQGYYEKGSLKHAKHDLVYKFKPNMAQIVCLIGPYKFEGRQAYYMTYSGTDHTNIKFKKYSKSQLIIKG